MAKKPREPKEVDVAIIGAGPAGLTAALFAARRELKCVVFEARAVGGEMATATAIENYPGFESVSGLELARLMQSQAQKFGARLVNEEVTKIARRNNFFELSTANSVWRARAIVLATGAWHKELGVKGEKEFAGKGVSYCASCDAPFFKGKRVAVVGGGNSALNTALWLAPVASKVFLVHRRNEFRGEEVLVKQARAAGVEFVLNAVPTEIIGDKTVRQLRVQDVETKSERVLEVDGVFIQVGVIPTSVLARSLGVELDEKSFIKTRERQETNVEGVFAAGDVTGKFLQVVEATAEGARAAFSAYEFVKKTREGLKPKT